MRAVFTIFYNVDEDLYIIYDDSYGKYTEFWVGDYYSVINSYLVYFIIYVCYYDFEKIYVGSQLTHTTYLISDDYRRYMDKHTKKTIKIKRYVKSKLINVLLRLLYKLGYNPKR